VTWYMGAEPSRKQRKVTPEPLRRERLVADHARQAADAAAAGRFFPPKVTAYRPRRPEPRDVPAAEHAALWAFAGTEAGRGIVKLLNEFPAERDQLRLLRAYRNCCRGEAGAFPAWVRLLLELRAR
jgi:hypothetical protein